MIKIFLTLMLLVLLPLTLDARRNGEGFFIGYGMGGTYYDDRGAVNDAGASSSDFSGSGKLYMGYKYNHELTLEGSVTSYGKYDITKDSEPYEKLIPWSAAVYVNYGHDFYHNQIRPFVILGGGLLWINGRENALYSDEVFFALHYGVGLLYTPNFLYGWGVRYAYEADWSKFGTTDQAKAAGADSAYNNFIGTVYIGLQYKF